MPVPPFLRMSGVRKRFGGVVALDGADFAADRGEVHALLGPNGSGKSTLLKVLTGAVEPDAGEVELAGERLSARGPRDALRAGIAAVYQELSLLPDLAVVDNLLLGVEPVRRGGFYDRRRARELAMPVLDRFADAFGGPVPADLPVARLDPGERQIVEICKALVRRPRVLVLDEATASLRAAQVAVLTEVVAELAAGGVTVVFTSHRLPEVFAVAARATVLRGGTAAGTVPLAGTTEPELVRLMVGGVPPSRIGPGAAPADTVPPPRDSGRAPRLEVRELAAGRLGGISLRVAPGEVVGLGGLQGQGQSDLLAAIFGAVRRRGGEVLVDGSAPARSGPPGAIAAGIAYVPGDRGREGLLERRPILENLALPSLARRARLGIALSRRRELAAAREAGRRLALRYGSLDDAVSTLSGGNQQKVVVGRWFATAPRVVLMDDPTKGIDVGAKAEMFAVVAELARAGAAVVLTSSEDRELVETCDRVLVMYEGRIVDELAGPRLTGDALMASALGVGR